jgi:hypothetical protein
MSTTAAAVFILLKNIKNGEKLLNNICMKEVCFFILKNIHLPFFQDDFLYFIDLS